MEKHRIVKRVNSTETGKSGTNDTYLLLSNLDGVNWHSIFDFNKELQFWDKRSGDFIKLKLTNPRNEKRVTKMGPYYRKYGISPGDAVVLECLVEQAKGQKFYSIDYVDNSGILTLSVKSGVLELYNNDDLTLLNNLVENNNLKIHGTNKSIQFIKKDTIKRRTRDIYPISIQIDGQEEIFDIKSTELIQIELISSKEIMVNKVNIIDYYNLEGK